MITANIVTEVRRLLAERKLSQRKIARRTGISRGSVGAIASGKRPDYEMPDRFAEEDEEPTGPPERCRNCGGMVYMPCRLCKARQTIAERRRSRTCETNETPELNLRPEHRARYEEVLAWRDRQGGVAPVAGAP